MNNLLNIQTKLMTILLIPLLSIIVILFVVFNSLSKVDSNFALVNESKNRTQVIGDLLVSLQNASSSLGFSLGSDSNELASVRNYEAQFNNSADDLNKHLGYLINGGQHDDVFLEIPNEEVTLLLTEANSILTQFITLSQKSFAIKKEILTSQSETGQYDTQKDVELLSLNDQIQRNKESLSNKVNEIVALNNEITTRGVVEYERTLSSLSSTILIGSAISVVVMIIAGYFVSFSLVTKPIKTLTDVASAISRGQLDAKIDQKILESTDEIGGLARAFDRTMVSLKLAMKSNSSR